MNVKYAKAPDIYVLYDELKSWLGYKFEFGLYGDLYIWAVPKTMFSWLYHFMPFNTYAVIIWYKYSKKIEIDKRYVGHFVHTLEKIGREDLEITAYDGWIHDGGL